jgi:hypothetical protein
MKTFNKNIKSILTNIGFIFSILMVAGFSVNAQKSFDQLNLRNLLKTEMETMNVVATENVATAVVKLDLYANSLDFVIEESLNVEEWMTNSSEWINSENEVADVATEQEIDLENWMSSDWALTAGLSNESVLEEEITLEDWMTGFTLENLQMEKEPELEAWMYTVESWK